MLNAQRRAGDPTEVAKLVVFVASDDAAYMTGSNLVIDGGGSLMSYLTTPRPQEQ